MGFVILLMMLLVSGWILIAAFRHLAARRAGIAWWAAFCVLVSVGGWIGLRLGFFFEYNVSPELRLVNFPIPTCAFHFEDGQWVDFPSPEWFAYSAAFTNVVVMTALVVLPLLAASLLRSRKSKT